MYDGVDVGVEFAELIPSVFFLLFASVLDRFSQIHLLVIDLVFFLFYGPALYDLDLAIAFVAI